MSGSLTELQYEGLIYLDAIELELVEVVSFPKSISVKCQRRLQQS